LGSGATSILPCLCGTSDRGCATSETRAIIAVCRGGAFHRHGQLKMPTTLASSCAMRMGRPSATSTSRKTMDDVRQPSCSRKMMREELQCETTRISRCKEGVTVVERHVSVALKRCQTAPHAPQQTSQLFDYLVGADEQRGCCTWDPWARALLIYSASSLSSYLTPASAI